MSEAWERSLIRLRDVDDQRMLQKNRMEQQKRKEAIPAHLKEEIKRRARSAEIELTYLQDAYYAAGFTKHSDDIGMLRASRLWDVMESGVPNEWLLEENG